VTIDQKRFPSSGALGALFLLASACAPQVEQQPVTTPAAPPPAPSAAPPPVDEPDTSAQADELIGRNVAARGGLDKLRAIRSLRLAGKARFGQDGSFELEFAAAQTRAGKLRYESTFQGMTGVDAYDGAEYWSTEPFGGRRDPFKQSADDAKQMAQDADLDGPLVDWRAKGHRVAYLGTEDIDGTLAHKLRVTRKDGDVEYRYLDPEAFLEIRIVKETRVRGVETINETDLGDYEQVAGVWMPLATESGRKGKPRNARYQYTRVEVNGALDDALFRFPAAGAAVTRAIVLDASATVKPSPAPTVSAAGGAPVVDSNVVSGLGARNIGSATMSGRVSALAAREDKGKTTLYVGAASGGVWKSLDGGTTWKPIFDQNPVQSIGAVTLDPTSPETVWVGTGEAWTRNSVSIGDGIYKSTDGGSTWKNMGLPASERIARILVHPKNGAVVYACVPGKLWSDSADRGVYKTEDGGRSWALVLKGSNLSTGCSGLSLDPANPDVLLAGMWDFRRKGWTFRSGGEGPEAASGSGMFRSADAGKTWTPLTAAANKGLPAGPWGRVEVVHAPSDGKIVYAMIESRDAGLFRSDDGGNTWEARDKSQNMVWRPFYFARLVVDPQNPERVFKPDQRLVVSEDGGRSFSDSAGGSHGDWHDVWVDPHNPKHLVGGDDGGLWISHDGGSRWWKSNNLPISQFYHVSLDAKDPYRVYGGLQDNSSWVGPSAAPGGITNQLWENVYGGDGFWTLVDPTDPEAVYAESQGGYIGRVDRRTHATRDIQPKAAYKEKLRFNWNTPIHVSPTQKGTLYLGGQFLFRSRDRGDSWERLSPDLTTNDPEKQKQELSGGITVDNSSAEMHTTIYAISESPRDPKVIWAGTDDGNLQLTRDAGKTWTNVVGNVKGLPKASWVSWVEASRFDAGTAYAAFDRHTFGDMDPWVYKTTDHGQTWTRIVSPAQGVRGYAHVIKEDVQSPGLLFAGTELGLWISVDGGVRWAEFKGGGFPSVAVREVQVHPGDHDLVLATHGRGIWIVDDLSPLRGLSADALARPAAFLLGRAAQQRMPAQGGWVEGDASFVGQNPAGGAVITFHQRARHLYGPLKLEVLDDQGKVIDTLAAGTRRGINRVVWSMLMKPPRAPRGAQVAYAATQGPRVLPGTYTVRLTKGAETIESKIEVTMDRRAPYKLADRKAQLEAALRAHALFGDMSALCDRIQAAQAGAEARAGALPAGDALVPRLRAAAKKLDEARRKIVATKEGGAVTGEERLREHLDTVYGALLGWEGRPAKYQVERLEVIRRELAEVAAELETIVAQDLRPLDAELKSRKLEPIPTTAATAEAEGTGGDLALAQAMRCAPARGACVTESRAGAARGRD
jgi:photosystem II stability/assembly factor-like uncharacterized protein